MFLSVKNLCWCVGRCVCMCLRQTAVDLGSLRKSWLFPLGPECTRPITFQRVLQQRAQLERPAQHHCDLVLWLYAEFCTFCVYIEEIFHKRGQISCIKTFYFFPKVYKNVIEGLCTSISQNYVFHDFPSCLAHSMNAVQFCVWCFYF